MSIDPRKDRKNYELTITGSRADLEGLSNVLEQALKRFDVDLYPEEKDIPGRISLTKGTAFQFSRAKRGLQELIEVLRNEESSAAINFGDIDLSEPRYNTPKSVELAVMDAVTDSRRRRTGVQATGVPIHDLMRDNNIFTASEYAEGDRGFPQLLTEANMRWMYVESLIGAEQPASNIKLKKATEIEQLKNYPPKLSGKTKKYFEDWAHKNKFNRAYIVLLEVEKSRPLTEQVRIKPGGWDATIKDLTAGKSILSFYSGKPPKTIGDIYIRIAAYAAGRAFDMADTVVVPFEISKMGKMPLVSSNDWEKIYKRDSVVTYRKNEVGEIVPEYRNFMAFLVVGRGTYKPVGLARAPEVLGTDLELPDL